MTTEERAREISESFYKPETGYDNEELYMSAMAMAEWKDKQMIEKACEWLEPVFKDLAGYNCGGDLIKDFRKAMEE